MRGRIVVTLLLALASCRGGGAEPGDERGGSFELRRVSGDDSERLARVAAAASWCEQDSSLAIIAIEHEGAGGFAARIAWPPQDGGDTLLVRRRLAGSGTATVAWRQIEPGVTWALVADSGHVVLQLGRDSALAGSLTGWATISDTVVVAIVGRFEDIPVVAQCPREGGRS
jgi:hypothetical protein